MTRVMAQGAFDIIHPGVLHYLRESADLGDDLVVVVARDANRSELIQDEDARLALVDALEIVDEAVLGSTEGFLNTAVNLQPDIITIGHNQDYAVDELDTLLAGRGLSATAVVRTSAYTGPDGDRDELRARVTPQER